MTNYCKVCGKPFEASWKGRRFCSQNCINEAKTKFKYDPDNPPKCLNCDKSLTRLQARKGIRFCCLLCANKYPENNQKAREFLKNKLKDPNFRNNIHNRMTTNNQSKNKETVQKVKNTKEKNGTLHTWLGERGGNGKVSLAEEKLMSFCTENGFLYNKAISTYKLRIQYPEKHYPFNYKPDFVNMDLKLCIEVDGDSHKTELGLLRDSKKEECLSILGYKIIRFDNRVVLDNLELVKQDILKEMEVLRNGKTSV